MNSNRDIIYKRSYEKRVLKQYLSELSKLIEIPIDSIELLSIEKTEKVKEFSICNINKDVKSSITIPFSQKDSILSSLFKKLQVNGDSEKVYFFTEYSQYCGVAFILLKNVNVNFQFADEHAGIISIVNSSCSDQIILDFFRDIENDEILTIDCIGERWGRCQFEL